MKSGGVDKDRIADAPLLPDQFRQRPVVTDAVLRTVLMPRCRRFASGGFGYHVLNRAVARDRLFRKPADYSRRAGI